MKVKVKGGVMKRCEPAVTNGIISGHTISSFIYAVDVNVEH
jgi:hypothetical protein